MSLRTTPEAFELHEIDSIARPLGSLALLLLLVMLLCLLPTGCTVSSSSASLPSGQQANQAATSTGTVPSTFFGMVVKSSSHLPTVRTGSRRLWDSGVTWAALEPSPNSFVWTTLDQQVAAAQSANAEVTLTLGMTPAWASSQPGLASAYGPGATAAPRNLSDWDGYLTAVATRYKGSIANYETWNAPTDATYWSGVAGAVGSDMALLTAHAAAVIHSIDPSARVIAPALDADGMRQFLAAGGNTSADAFTVALSLAGQAPEALIAELAAVRQAMTNSQAQTKPLWNDQPSWSLAQGLSDADQAAYVARSLLLNASFGIGRMAWYAWDESESSALRLTDTKRPANRSGGSLRRSGGVVERSTDQWLLGRCGAGLEVSACARRAAGVGPMERER